MTEVLLTELATYSDELAVINDDLRDPGDADRLRAAGFRLVRLVCPETVRQARLATRADVSLLDERTKFGPALEAMTVDLEFSTLAPAIELAEHILTTFTGGGQHAGS